MPKLSRGATPEFRPFREIDREHLVRLWSVCDLLRPWNEPNADIDTKVDRDPDGLIVLLEQERVIGSVMVGYEGHRGWVNYLAIHPDRRSQGLGTLLMTAAEKLLAAMGCPKVNLQIRTANRDVVGFYQRLGYELDGVVSMGKRLGGTGTNRVESDDHDLEAARSATHDEANSDAYETSLSHPTLPQRLAATCRIEGQFPLRSGKVSSEYFDKYLFESNPGLLLEVAKGMVGLLPACDVLAGMEMGGIPLVTAMSQVTGLPAVFVRKKAKEYGTQKAIEGIAVAGLRAVAVEDVVTTAGAIVAGCGHLRDAGHGDVRVRVQRHDQDSGGQRGPAPDRPGDSLHGRQFGQ